MAYDRCVGCRASARTLPSSANAHAIGEVVRAFERDLGSVVEEAHSGWEDPYRVFRGVVAAESDGKGLREIAAKHGTKMTPHLVDFINHPWTAEEFTSANIVRKAVTNRMWRVMRRYDVLLTPTLAVLPFALHIPGSGKDQRTHGAAFPAARLHLSDEPDGQSGGECAGRVRVRRAAGGPADRRPASSRRHSATRSGLIRGGEAWADRRPVIARDTAWPWGGHNVGCRLDNTRFINQTKPPHSRFRYHLGSSRNDKECRVAKNLEKAPVR